MNNTSERVDLHVLRKECSSSQLRPSFRVVSMVVADDDAADQGIRYLFDYI